jgi:hypothetical protein
LADRLLKLEKENRWFKRGGVAALLLVGTLLAMGQTSVNRTIEAQSFVLKDDTGRMRAALAMVQGVPQLSFYDAGEKFRMALELSKDGPMLDFRDANGRPRVTMVAIDNGPADLSFMEGVGSNGNLAVDLQSWGEDSHLTLTDRDGFATSLGTSRLQSSRTGETQISSAASIVLFDKQQKVIWRAP